MITYVCGLVKSREVPEAKLAVAKVDRVKVGARAATLVVAGTFTPRVVPEIVADREPGNVMVNISLALLAAVLLTFTV